MKIFDKSGLFLVSISFFLIFPLFINYFRLSYVSQIRELRNSFFLKIPFIKSQKIDKNLENNKKRILLFWLLIFYHLLWIHSV